MGFKSSAFRFMIPTLRCYNTKCTNKVVVTEQATALHAGIEPWYEIKIKTPAWLDYGHVETRYYCSDCYEYLIKPNLI